MRARACEGAWRWGVVTGLAYINMAAAWGGYIFVLNMIGMHAVMLVAIDRPHLIQRVHNVVHRLVVAHDTVLIQNPHHFVGHLAPLLGDRRLQLTLLRFALFSQEGHLSRLVSGHLGLEEVKLWRAEGEVRGEQR